MEKLFEKLHEKEIFFRFENDEFGFYISIIDRMSYPRVWVDNDNSRLCGKILTESTESNVKKSTMPGVDWEERFHSETIDGLIEQVEGYLTYLP